VIKSQTKAKTRSLERASIGPLKQGQGLNTTETKCSKLLTPQGEAKGFDTIGKRAKRKAHSGDTTAPLQACNLPMNKCMQNSSSPTELSIHLFVPIDATLPLVMNWMHIFSPLLVIHESRLEMQACASQIDKEHYNMLKMRHRQARWPHIHYKHRQQDRKKHISMWHSHDQNEAFSTKTSLS
jgi:hypothetical protein